MIRFSKVLTATALTSMVATSAAADISPRDVWDSWSGYLSGFGYEISATETESSRGLAVSNLTLGMQLPEDEGRLQVTMGDFDFVDQGDGTVAIVMPSEIPLRATVDGGSEDVVMLVNLAYTGLEVTASGAPMDILYNYAATSSSATLAELVVGGEKIENLAAAISMSNLQGASSVVFGDLISVAQSISIGAMSVNVEGADPGGDSFTLNVSVADLGIEGSGDVPTNVDPEDPMAMFANGFGFEGGFSHGETSAQMNVEEGKGPTNIAVSSSGGALDVALNNEYVAYSGSTQGLSADIFSAEVPLPISFSATEFGYGFLMPLLASELEQEFGFHLDLIDLSVADMLWGIFDAGGVLPHDPATLVFDASGYVTILADLMSPEAQESNDFPGEINALDFNELTVRAAGASAEGTGSFTFDNTDKETFDGMPRPIGSIEMNVVGINGLIDNLISMGLLPEDQAMGARMMLSMFSVPGPGEDELNSVLEINEEGHILANGQRIQ